MLAAPRFEREGLTPPGNFEAVAAHAAQMTSDRRTDAPVPATCGQHSSLLASSFRDGCQAHLRHKSVSVTWRVFYRQTRVRSKDGCSRWAGSAELRLLSA